ncbi:MAG: hypothetical protein P8Y05_04725 [Deinococcales bacterium]|jgi:hypothetical protein
MHQVHQPEAELRLQRRLLRYLAPAERIAESAHLGRVVVDRLAVVFDHDEERIRAFLDTPDAELADNTPADIARLHGFDALDRLVDQVEYTAPA